MAKGFCFLNQLKQELLPENSQLQCFFFHQMSFNLSHCQTVYCFSNWRCNENKTIDWENLINFVAAAIVSAIVPWPNVRQKCGVLIGLNCILLWLNNSSQITKLLLDQDDFLVKGSGQKKCSRQGDPIFGGSCVRKPLPLKSSKTTGVQQAARKIKRAKIGVNKEARSIKAAKLGVHSTKNWKNVGKIGVNRLK